MAITQARLAEVIQDAIAQKRVIKWGYVRQFGGLYAAECDSVASHSSAVSVLATILGYEYAGDIERATGVRLRLDDITLLATFHDLGEGRSGDTGASSYAVRGICNLHSLEREGLAATVRSLTIEEKVLRLFDDYRAYGTPEAIMVHVADNLEGFEKAVHSCRKRGVGLDGCLEIVKSNIEIYRGKASTDAVLGKVGEYVVGSILLPGVAAIAEAYCLDEKIFREAGLTEVADFPRKAAAALR